MRMGGGASRTGEHWGKTPRPDFTTSGAAELAGRMPASWRADSSATGGGAVAGDGEAIGVTGQQRDCIQRHIVGHLLPAQGLGVPCAPGINDGRVTHNMCCMRSRKHSCMPTEPRSSRLFVGASGLVAWHRRASAMT